MRMRMRMFVVMSWDEDWNNNLPIFCLPPAAVSVIHVGVCSSQPSGAAGSEQLAGSSR
jgi:hypothetical protein